MRPLQFWEDGHDVWHLAPPRLKARRLLIDWYLRLSEDQLREALGQMKAT